MDNNGEFSQNQMLAKNQQRQPQHQSIKFGHEMNCLGHAVALAKSATFNAIISQPPFENQMAESRTVKQIVPPKLASNTFVNAAAGPGRVTPLRNTNSNQTGGLNVDHVAKLWRARHPQMNRQPNLRGQKSANSACCTPPPPRHTNGHHQNQ